MKTTILLVTALGLIAGCASTNMSGGKGITVPACDILQIRKPCTNLQGSSKNDPKVNFNKNSLNLSPRHVCAAPGSKITFNITPAALSQNPKGSVAVISKDLKDYWLFGNNSDDNQEIEITVPSGATIGDYFDYTIVSVSAEGVVSCVDPRVHVQ